MRTILTFLWLVVVRIKNRLLISLYHKPESAFILFLFVVFGSSLVALAPSLFRFHIQMNITLFPTAAYIFLIGGLFPYIFFVMRNPNRDDTEGSLLHYICSVFLKYFKNILSYLSPMGLSMIILVIILSIYDNISLFYSLLFWQVLAQTYFITAFAVERILQKFLSRYITANQYLLVKYGIFLGFLAVELSIPVHTQIGEWWLDKKIPTLILLGIMIAFFLVYSLVGSRQIEHQRIRLFRDRSSKWFHQLNGRLGGLVLLHSQDYVIFNVFIVLFIAIISKLAGNYYSLNEVFVLFFILGGTSFTFSNLLKISPGIEILRLSHFKYTGYLLHIYFIVGNVFLLVYLQLVAILHHQPFLFLLKTIDFKTVIVMNYFSLYSAIVIYYLFHRFFGLMAQWMTSLFILIVSYRILPEYLSRVEALNSLFGEVTAISVTVITLLLILFLTIGGYQDDTEIG